MRAWIPGCDYVWKEQDSQDSIESIEWFNDFFHIDISIETVNASGNNISVGVINPIDIIGIVKALKADKENRLREMRKEVQKDNPDMWCISHAYMDSAFYFVFTGETSFDNEMELLESNIKPEDGPLYITEIYDYHC